MKLKIIGIVVLLSVSIVIGVASVVQAQTNLTSDYARTKSFGVDPVECSFTPSATFFGLELSNDSKACGSLLLAEYLVALNNFLFRLAVALAVVMVMIGGFQWMVAIGNSSKISNAKDTIQQAVIGLILAATATLLFNQIDSSFTNLGALNVPRPDTSGAVCANITGPSQCTGSCRWICPDGTPIQDSSSGKCGATGDDAVPGSCQSIQGSAEQCTSLLATLPSPTSGCVSTTLANYQACNNALADEGWQPVCCNTSEGTSSVTTELYLCNREFTNVTSGTAGVGSAADLCRTKNDSYRQVPFSNCQ